jgi:hypothetical protein
MKKLTDLFHSLNILKSASRENGLIAMTQLPLSMNGEIKTVMKFHFV